MNLVDEELQAKIDKLDQITQDIGSNLFGAVSTAARIAEVFPIPKNGNERSGEKDTQGKSNIQESQVGPSSQT
jgi:hypothetical protein